VIERSTRLDIRHRKSNIPFSELQKLNVYYQMQRRWLLGAKAQLEGAIRHNPGLRIHCHDALRAIGAAEDALRNEFTRDREALLKHTTEANHD
jgi:hypothetical protein